MRAFLKVAVAFVVTVMITTAAGSIAQTQFNLASLQELGVAIAFSERAQATWHDLLSFTPAWGAIVAVSLALALSTAWLLRRWLLVPRSPWYALAGLSGIASALLIMELLLPITAVAATRSAAGMTVMILSGALGGWLYARLSPEPAA